MAKTKPPAAKLFVLLAIFYFTSGQAQNIVQLTATDLAANPAKLTEMDFSEFIVLAPDFGQAPHGPEALRAAEKLEKHVSQFLEGRPWRPFHHTLGISGYEVYFNHPDEMFYALSIALPCLSKAAAEKTKMFLAAQLRQSPPYTVQGFDHGAGKPRESYDVPEGVRPGGTGQANSAFGVYAFWAYCHYAWDNGAATSHWESVKTRAAPLLKGNYPFDIRRPDYANDEAEKLNGDLAGLIGLTRLAQINGDVELEKQALVRGTQLLELRVNLERVNPNTLEKSQSSSKHLHHYKLARYCDLAPEVGQALRTLSAGCGPARLKAFREERNSWYLAFGDRLVGGENYTSPPHLARSLFAGAVFVEQLPPATLFTFLDLPWCKGDFYFIEKCATALWASGGRTWSRLSGN